VAAKSSARQLKAQPLTVSQLHASGPGLSLSRPNHKAESAQNNSLGGKIHRLRMYYRSTAKP